MNVVHETVQNWWYAIKNRFSDIPVWLFSVLIFFVVGFGVTFVAKKIGRTVCMLFVGLTIIIVLLDFLSIMSLQAIAAFFPADSLRDYADEAAYWLHEHKVETIASCCGAFLGWRL